MAIAIECHQDRLFEILNENSQDPHVSGTVVFRGQKFSHDCVFGKDRVEVLYHHSFTRCRKSNLGCFQMIQEPQSNMSSREAWGCLKIKCNSITYFNNVTMNYEYFSGTGIPDLVGKSGRNSGKFRRISDSGPIFDPFYSDSDSASERKNRSRHRSPRLRLSYSLINYLPATNLRAFF